MSRAFVKEDDGEGGDALPDRSVSEHANYVTAEGLALIDKEFARLGAALVEAGEDRALRANIERDLRYWRQRHATAEIVPPPSETDTVRFGSTVTIARDDGREQTWRIVGEDEADPAKGTLSYVSPLAAALSGKGVGDTVEVAGGEADHQNCLICWLLDIPSAPDIKGKLAVYSRIRRIRWARAILSSAN